jgi:Flp pilus assembly protein TadD
MSIVAIAILVAGSVMAWEVTRSPDPQGVAGGAAEPATAAWAGADPDSDASAARPTGVGPDASGDALAAAPAKAVADDVEPTTAPGHFRRGTRHFMDGNLADAQARFEAAVALDPGYCAAHRALGVVHAARQNGRRSVEAYQRYLTCSPRVADDSEIRRRIAVLGGETSAAGDGR